MEVTRFGLPSESVALGTIKCANESHPPKPTSWCISLYVIAAARRGLEERGEPRPHCVRLLTWGRKRGQTCGGVSIPESGAPKCCCVTVRGHGQFRRGHSCELSAGGAAKRQVQYAGVDPRESGPVDSFSQAAHVFGCLNVRRAVWA
ncbi:hypothetical protein GCM10027287_27130 [Bordetella muralis]